MTTRYPRREMGFFIVIALVMISLVALVPTITAQETEHDSIPPRIGLSENTSRVLYLDSPDHASFGAPSLTVTDSLATQTANTESRLVVYSLKTQLSNAETESQLRSISQNASLYFQMETNRLHALESQKRTQLREGEISKAEYLRTLGAIHRRAGNLHERISVLRSNERLTSEARTDLSNVESDLVGLEGPLRSGLASALDGSGDPSKVFVTTSGAGVTLSKIQDGTFIHEAYIPANRDGVIGSLSFDEAINITRAYYPYLNQQSTGRSLSSQNPDLLEFSIGGPNGDTRGYLDTSTQQVFFEVHRLSLGEGIETEPLRTVSSNNTTLIVSDSYVGGPLKIRVENQTGSPLRADVYLNKTHVGRTNDAGNYWTIARRPPYPVRVTTDEANISANVTRFSK